MRYARPFNCQTKWDEDIQYEIRTAVDEIEDNIPLVLQRVGSEMINNLQSHIQKDVYDAYTPTSYPRRKDHPQFGTPLDDIKNFSTHIERDYGMTTLYFDYNPDGTHKGKIWDTLDYEFDESNPRAGTTRTPGAQPIKPKPVHGDKLINRIQTAKGYDWGKEGQFPQRPFWSNFVQEEIESGGVKNRFDDMVENTRMTQYDYSFKKQYGKTDYSWDGNDGALSTTDTW